jgi:cadmium resistance protein CadD (predicted permease)
MKIEVYKPVFLTLSAIADHLRKIPHSQKCMEVYRKNIIPVVQITITAFFYTLIWSIL